MPILIKSGFNVVCETCGTPAPGAFDQATAIANALSAHYVDFTVPAPAPRQGEVIYVCSVCLTNAATQAAAAAAITPIANVGPDQSVAQGATVTLDGSTSTDPKGATLTYQWAQTAGPTVTLSNTTVVKPTFTAPGDPGLLTFSLIVSNSTLSSSASTCNVTVN